MAIIIAAGFETYVEAQEALRRLAQAGVNSEYLCEFAVNPPGMHDTTPVGGDRNESPGAQHMDSGATKGAAVGAAVGTVAGVAITPLLGPAGIVAGAGVGAYTGSLLGGVKKGIDETPQPDHTTMRPAEALIAVNIDGAGIGEDAVTRAFEEAGAWQIERTEGRWENGEWADFNPLHPPHLIGGRDPEAGAGRESSAPR